MKIQFLEPAEIEMLEAAAYYELQVKALGKNFKIGFQTKH